MAIDSISSYRTLVLRPTIPTQEFHDLLGQMNHETTPKGVLEHMDLMLHIPVDPKKPPCHPQERIDYHRKLMRQGLISTVSADELSFGPFNMETGKHEGLAGYRDNRTDETRSASIMKFRDFMNEAAKDRAAK